MNDRAQLLVEQLGIWTGAIERKNGAGRGNGGKVSLHGIEKLRGLILDLAVRGKLVRQNPSDESASELLRRIKKRKASIGGKLDQKSSAKSPAIQWIIPSGWEWCSVEEVAEYIQRGKGPRYDDNNGSALVISQKCIRWSGFDLSAARRIAEESLPGYTEERFLRPGDVMWNSTGTGTVGRATVFPEAIQDRAVVDSHVTIVRPLLVDPRFITIFIASSEVQARMEPEHSTPLVSGTTNQVELNTSSVRTLPFPLPPLAEQKRIVAKVDQLMALCDALEAGTREAMAAHEKLVRELLATLVNSTDADDLATNWSRIEAHFDTLFTTEESMEALKQTIFALAVQGKLVPQQEEDPPATALLRDIARQREVLLNSGYPNVSEAVTQKKKQQEQSIPKNLPNLPRGWAWATLMQCSLMVIDCKNKTAPYETTGVRLIRTTNVRNGVLNDIDQKFVSDDIYEKWSLRAKPEAGDLLITREAPMGEACIIPEGEILCLGQRMMLARAVPHTVCVEYLLVTFMSPDLMERVQDKPVGMTVEHLRVGGVETLLIPLPPKSEQARIVERVKELLRLANEASVGVSRLTTIEAHLADLVTSVV